jgi:O-antigen ligase
VAFGVAIAVLPLLDVSFWQRLRTFERFAPEPRTAAAASSSDPERSTSALPAPLRSEASVAVQDSLIEDHGFRGRVSEALSALLMIREHPLFGVGSAQVEARYQEYASRLGIDSRSHRGTHSLYLEVAAELGVIGLAAFGALLFVLFRGLLRCVRQLRATGLVDDGAWVGGFALGLTGYFAAALFLHLSYAHLLLLLLGVGFAIPLAYPEGSLETTTASARP